MFKILKFLKKNIYLLSFMVLALGVIYMLSNVIFDIDIIHSNSKIVELLDRELKEHGLKKYSFVKDYQDIEKIKEEILEDNKDSLEWIEIIREGTKYIVRVEERIINSNNKDDKVYDIVASKSAVLKSIEASRGEKVKDKDTYVKKGEVIISSDVTLPSNEKIRIGASGKVVGEVWYKVDIEYPYYYHEVKYTGKKKKVLVFNFNRKRISFFDFHAYKHFNKDVKVIFEDNYLPISLAYEYQYETNVTDEVYTRDEARDKAIEKAKVRLKEKYKMIIDVTDIKILKEEDLGNHLYLSLFMTCNEDITKYQEAIDNIENNNNEDSSF